MTSTLPARLNLQIRDGVQNEIYAFQLRVNRSEPAAADEPGHTVHDVHSVDIVWALAAALRKESALALERVQPERREHARESMHALLDWVKEGV